MWNAQRRLVWLAKAPRSQRKTNMQSAEDAKVMEEEQAGRTGDACAMVIFGASGDLTKRKLIPALYNLAKENLLSKEFALIGFARSEMSSDQFRKLIGDETQRIRHHRGRS